jgi:hypothetical protein
MLKPLLKVLPTLSGNVKLVCEITKYEQIDNETFNAYVRSARLLPLSNNLIHKNCYVNLATSMFEQDMKRFYDLYNQYFYKHCFEYSKNDYAQFNYSDTINNRNTNFEFGVKRISYLKNKHQFAFFAPIYIESENDLPDYFLITIKVKNEYYKIARNIKVNIKANNNHDQNYLYVYLNKYAKKINDNVIYCLPKTGQATYDGIDLKYGTLAKETDNVISKIFNKQMTINNFDATVSTGWERNKMCMKQIIPLCFYFNVNDIFDDLEKQKYANTKLNITGEYYKNGSKCKFYDIDTNYNEFNQSVLKLNNMNGIFDYVNNSNNILNMPEPSLNDCMFVGYEYSNKINYSYNRWKLKYSSDKHPYITNMSPAFSMNQDSTYKYGEYPTKYNTINIVSDINNNLVIPINNNVISGIKYYNNSIVDNYNKILNNYATTWFNSILNIERYKRVTVYGVGDIDINKTYYKFDDVTNVYKPYTLDEIINIKNEIKENNNKFQSIDLYEYTSIFDDHFNWSDVVDNKTYFNGILYDLSSVYNTFVDLPKIDKFNVFVRSNFKLFHKGELDKIKESRLTVCSNIIYSGSGRNCSVPSNIEMHFKTQKFNEAANNFFLPDTYQLTDELKFNKIFIKHSNADNTDGDFINLAQYNFDYYNANTYYKLSNVIAQFTSTKNNTIFTANINKLLNDYPNIQSKYIYGYELLPIYRLSDVFDEHSYSQYNNFIFSRDVDLQNGSWVRDSLYYSDGCNNTKTKYGHHALKKLYDEYKNEKYRIPLYLYDIFVSKDLLRDAIIHYFDNGSDKKLMEKNIDIHCNALNELDEYEFLPIVKLENKDVAKNVFIKRDKFTGRMYGDHIPSKYYKYDNNILYVDQYNLYNVISNYNTRYPDNKINLLNSTNDFNEFNSKAMYAKVLNKLHLRYYFNRLHNGYFYQTELDDKKEITTKNHPLHDIYVKIRHIYNDYYNHNLFVKDNYVKLIDLYNITNDTIDGYSLNSVEGYNIFANKVLIDLNYKNGCWYFSKEFVEENNVFERLNINNNYSDNNSGNKIIYDNVYFELYYYKRFIKVDESIYNLINLIGKDELPYKDLYIYNVEQNPSTPLLCKYYANGIDTKKILTGIHVNNYNDSIEYNNTQYKQSYEISESLVPLFDSIFLQDKDETILYKEFNQSRIVEANYQIIDEEFHIQIDSGKYYRYGTPDINIMYDISEYTNYPIITVDEQTGKNVFYYAYSHITEEDKHLLVDYPSTYKYLETYDPIDPPTCGFTLSSSYTVNKIPEIIKTETDLSYAYIGTKTTYDYYSVNMFNRLYPTDYLESLNNDEDESKHIHYEINDNIVSTWKNETYTYYNVINTYTYTYLREYNTFDDLGIYDAFKLNTVSIPYSYAYTYSVVEQQVETISDENHSFVSYNIVKNVDVEYTGYYTGYMTYAFYLIDVNYDNTRCSFNLVNEQGLPKKYFTYINGKSIYNDYNEEMFSLLVPTLRTNILNTFLKQSTLHVKPTSKNIPILYNQKHLDNKNITYAYNIELLPITSSSFTLDRYFNNIVPYIKETNILEHSYCLKYKDNNNIMLTNYENNVLYDTTLSIYKYKPYRIYTDNTTYTEYTPIEYKHFNDNMLINLETEINIHVGDNLTINDIDTLCIEANIIDLFKKYINTDGKHNYNDNDILFLYNRYKVNSEYVGTGLNEQKTEKLYTLNHKFTLL